MPNSPTPSQPDPPTILSGNAPRVLVAIPVFNELKYVAGVIEKVKRFHDHIVLIDDGSSDGTAQLLQGFAQRGEIQLVSHDRNRGYGQSIIDAFNYADEHRYDWVITMDCDEQHEPKMIPKFIEHVERDRWDVISGSRYMQSRQDDDLPPGDRRAINQTITTTLNERFHFGITDGFCGFKAHRVRSMIPLKLDETGYAFPLQFWPRVARAGLRVCEIPVRLIYKDPNRQFGGGLDDAKARLEHYLAVLSREVEAGAAPLAAVDSSGDSRRATCYCGE